MKCFDTWLNFGKFAFHDKNKGKTFHIFALMVGILAIPEERKCPRIVPSCPRMLSLCQLRGTLKIENFKKFEFSDPINEF